MDVQPSVGWSSRVVLQDGGRHSSAPAAMLSQCLMVSGLSRYRAAEEKLHATATESQVSPSFVVCVSPAQKSVHSGRSMRDSAILESPLLLHRSSVPLS